MSRRILVTGGTGFIGTHLCRLLRERGLQVRVMDLAQPRGDTRVPDVEYRFGDVRDDANLDSSLEDVSAVVHLAARVSVPLCQKEPVESSRTNLLATLQLTEAMRRCEVPGPLIFASSAAVYGNAGREGVPLTEDKTTLALDSYYAEQKLGSEQFLRLAHAQWGLPCLSFRFFNIYGTGQDPRSSYAGAISIFSRLILEGQPIQLHGGGNQTRDFISVRDIVRAVADSLELPRKYLDGGAVNLGSGTAIRLKDLAQLMMEISGKEVEVRSNPPREGDIKHSLAAIGKAREILGWEPEISLESGLRELLGGAG